MQRAASVTAPLIVLLLAGGCASQQTSRVYSIRYTVGFDRYDDVAAKQQLAQCVSLPGAARGGQNDSNPPQPFVRFSGNDEQRRDLETCLRRLPGTTFTVR